MVAKTFGTNIAEQSSTLGISTYQLDGALLGYRKFADDFVTGDTPYYAVRNANESKYEFNKGTTTFTDATPDTLARAVWLSSNANAAVSWSADDLPLIIYIPTAAELFEFMVKSWLDTARNAAIKFGDWWKKDGISSGIHQLFFYDGASDIQLATLDATNHKYILASGAVGQEVVFETGAMLQTNTTLAVTTDAIPTNTAGAQIMSLAITPKFGPTVSKLVVEVVALCTIDSGAGTAGIALFQDSVANAITMHTQAPASNGYTIPHSIKKDITSGFSAGVATTFKIRVGTNSGGFITFNGQSGARIGGGILNSYMRIREVGI